MCTVCTHICAHKCVCVYNYQKKKKKQQKRVKGKDLHWLPQITIHDFTKRRKNNNLKKMCQDEVKQDWSHKIP